MGMIKSEFRSIKSNRIIMMSLLAIAFIPFLYSIFFLKSVWDPYGSTGDLPVAVVNNDKSVKFNGKEITAGKDLVKQLKTNNKLDWHFVSAAKAKQGIENKKYYAVITIPSNFSKNAATVLDKTPKKMSLDYKTNDSLNYIGSVISQSAAKEVNTRVRAAITKSYAKVMFAQIETAGKGFDTAAKGSKKLNKGSNKLTTGLKTYTAGVSKVNKGVITLSAGVKPLSTGVAKLSNGSVQLTNGLATLNQSTGTLATGVNKLATGSSTLSSGVKTYTNGVASANTGAQQLNSGLSTLNQSTGTLATGVNKLTSGSNTLSSGVKTYTNGVASANTGAQQLNSGLSTLNQSTGTLATGVNKLTSGSNTLSSGVKTYTNGVASAYKGSQQLNAGLQKMQAAVQASDTKDKKSQLAQLQAGAKQIDTGLSTLKTEVAGGNAEVTAKLTDIGTELESIKSDLTDVQTKISKSLATTLPADLKASLVKINNDKKLNLTSDQLAAISAYIAGGVATDVNKAITNALDAAVIKDLTTRLTNIGNDAASTGASLKTANAKLSSGVDNLYTGYHDQLYPGITSLTTQVGAMSTSVTALATGASQLNAGLAQLTANSSQLTSGASQLSSGLNQVNSKVPTLTSGVAKLASGSSQLASGTAKLTANNDQLTSGASQLSTGLGQLNSKVPTLTSGVAKLASGSSQLANGTAKLTANNNQLTSGASQLSTGLGQLNSKVPTLTSGVNKLYSGSTSLSNGLSQLNSKVPTLSSGITQLASGTNQLSDNSATLVNGSSKITKGTKQLSSALATGAAKVNGIKLTNKTADMFSSPTKLHHSYYSYVKNYGLALAPYVLSLALYVGALVFNFIYPIRRINMLGQSATAWFLSKVLIGGVMAVVMAVVQVGLMFVGGIEAQHPIQTFLVAIVFALTSIYIVMFLSMTFDNPGRFLGMVLLMLQLGGSGGTFPMQLTNGFFNAIHPFLPMTYSILALRQTLTGGLGGQQIEQSIIIMFVFMIVALGLLWLGMHHLQAKRLKNDWEETPKEA
ncbi:putative membrane protein [Weissella beninensis]|nr:YhgE/Pip domain-containing protein [Periweissella beninensis]MBM7543963.1 putative membrane protein [Periweissella beninensis]